MTKTETPQNPKVFPLVVDGDPCRVLWSEGLDLRDYFAAKIVTALILKFGESDGHSRKAYQISDEMLMERVSE